MLTGANYMKRLARTQVLREGVFNMGSNLPLHELWTVLFVGGLCLLLAASGFAQGIVTGSIAGTVQDQQGAVIAGATVNAVGVATGTKFLSKSDSQGYFELKGLPIGSYSLTIEAHGFRNLHVSDVVAVAGKNNVLPAQTLEIGSASETVTVEATTPLIDSSSSQIGGNFDSKTVASLPNAGAGFDNLALFIPGVANNGSTNFSNTNGAAIANNGLRGRSNNFQIDGQANNDNSVAGPLVFLSNPDILGELQVVSNNFSAEYGRNSGTVVNYITKAGTNAFHGSGYEFYEGNWDRSLTNGQKNALLGFCPPGVAAGTATPFATSCKTPVIPRFVNNRWGGTFGGPVLKNRIWFFGSYQQQQQRAVNSATSSSLTPTPAGLTALAAAFPNNTAVSAIQQFGPYGITAGNPQPAGTVQNVTVSNGTTAVSVPFAFVNRVVGDNFDDTQNQSNSAWTRGRHTFKFGGELDHQSSPNHFLPSINGGFSFFSSPDIKDALGNIITPAASAFSYFLRGASNCPAPDARSNWNGICSQLSLTDGPFNFNFKENDLAFYGQDDWRIRSNLTLNLGLRWEWDKQAINLLHDITVQNVAKGFWAAGLPTNVTEIPHIPEDFNNYGPNFGFAWTPRILKKLIGEDKTVIRGGYRVAYDP